MKWLFVIFAACANVGYAYETSKYKQKQEKKEKSNNESLHICTMLNYWVIAVDKTPIFKKNAKHDTNHLSNHDDVFAPIKL